MNDRRKVKELITNNARLSIMIVEKGYESEFVVPSIVGHLISTSKPNWRYDGEFIDRATEIMTKQN